MKTLAEDARVVLLQDPGQDPATLPPITAQTVEITRSGIPAIIGIDGHASFWDDLVEVRWRGAHREQLAQACHVEIRDRTGRLLESLPMNPTRKPYEEGGETVFFLADSE